MSAIVTSIAKVMEEVGAVEKRGINEFHRYKYASASDILHKLQPLMAREGLVVFQNEKSREFLEGGTILAVNYEFTIAHKSGDTWPEKIVRTGMAAARNTKGGFDDKALNKCHTSAHKYFHLTLFEIPTGDYEDPDADEDTPPQRQQQIQKKEQAPEPSPAEEMVKAVKARPSIASLDKLWQNANFKREYSLLNPEDQAWVKSVDESKRKELEADPDATAMPENREPPATKPQSRASQLADDHIPF
jgi:hypothetical protein